MNDLEFVDVIRKIINEFGDDVLGNSQKAHAILMDLSQDQKRDRLLARHFVEAGGWSLLKKGESALIVRRLREDFSIEVNAAAWIVSVFAQAADIKIGPATQPAPKTESFDPVFFVGAEVSIGMNHIVAILRDGTVVADGKNDFLQCDVDSFRDIVSVATGDAHTVGLKSDGTVIAVGRNNHDQCNVGGLTDIAAIYAFGDDTICINQDGTAVSVGKSDYGLSHFEQIRSIAWHPEGVYGIRHDGRVMMSSSDWEEENWAMVLMDVNQIISTYVDGSLALCSDGRVYKMNEPDSYFSNLQDIAAMVDLSDGFAVLRRDGTVRILPYDRNKPRIATAADKWQNIIAIYGKYKRLIALTEEGKLLTACTDPDWLRRNSNLNFTDSWYPVGTQPNGSVPVVSTS